MILNNFIGFLTSLRHITLIQYNIMVLLKLTRMTCGGNSTT